MHVLDANELFGITSYTYDQIMAIGGRSGPDAFALYFKLMKQARMQQTNQTYSLNSFLKEGMGWGDDRLRNAKNILKKLGLVDDVNLQDEHGKIVGHFVRVNYLIDEERVRTSGMTYNLATTGFGPELVENQQWVPTTTGGTDTNALSTKYINAGSTKNKKGVKKPSPSVDELVEAFRNDERVNKDFNEEDIVEWLEYKQNKKQMYATAKSFISILVVAKRDICLGEPKLDTNKRFGFAVNLAIGNGWDGIHWYEETEKQYSRTKRDFYPVNNQDE